MSFADKQPIIQIVLYDGYGRAYAVPDGYAVPLNTPSNIFAGIDEYGVCRRIMLVEDEAIPDLWRLAITGKVSVQIAPPPVGGLARSYYADDPLEIGSLLSPHDTSYVIEDGKTFHIQQVIAGCQGDPSEDGSKVEIIFNDGTEHVVDRIYVHGETQFGDYPDTHTARDGTQLLGNGTNTIILRRTRLSNSTQEIDAVVRGYIV